MFKVKRLFSIACATALALSLAACGSSNKDSGADKDGKVTLTLSAWNISTIPEFKILADGFHAKNPNINIKLKEYPAKDYITLLITDLSAGKGPDIYPIKSMVWYQYFIKNQQMADVSDIAKKYVGEKSVNMKPFELDGKYYAMPYRQDGNVMYYNKDLFKKAGIPEPDGTWSWDKFVQVSKDLTEKLRGDMGPSFRGAYIHPWPIWCNYATAQTPGASYLGGNFDYMAKYYQYGVDLQNSGAAESFANASTQKLAYQAQFGKQRTALMPMGTWYVAMLLEQQKKGEADTFNWGIAPVPQYDSSSDGKPITYGSPTPMAMNPTLSGAKAEAAKKFLSYITSPDAAKSLAERGTFPANLTPSVLKAYLGQQGMPQDELTKKTLQDEVIVNSTPVSDMTTDVMAIVNDMNTSIMNENKSIKDAIAEANSKLQSKHLYEKK